MKKATFVLTIRVRVQREDGDHLTETDLEQIKTNLDYMPRHMAGNGLFTDDAPEVVVDAWDHTLRELKPRKQA